MTRPGDIRFPRPSANINHTECAERSQRPADVSLSVPCPVCNHLGCQVYIWTDEDDVQRELGCEVCSLVLYARALNSRTGNLETDGGNALQQVRARVTALENTRPTNAQLGAVNAKVDNLKTRVDNAGIP